MFQFRLHLCEITLEWMNALGHFYKERLSRWSNGILSKLFTLHWTNNCVYFPFPNPRLISIMLLLIIRTYLLLLLNHKSNIERALIWTRPLVEYVWLAKSLKTDIIKMVSFCAGRRPDFLVYYNNCGRGTCFWITVKGNLCMSETVTIWQDKSLAVLQKEKKKKEAWCYRVLT